MEEAGKGSTYEYNSSLENSQSLELFRYGGLAVCELRGPLTKKQVETGIPFAF